MFLSIFKFELRQQLKRPFTAIFWILMVAQGLYYMKHSGEFYSADKTYANAPAILYIVLAGMGYLCFIIAAMLGGNALGKDRDHRSTALFYTTRVSESTFFSARFFSGLLLLIILNSGYLLGIVLYNYMGIAPAENIGPFSWFALGRSFILIFLPNLFILYSLCFSVSVFTASSKTSFGVMLACLMLMIFAETSFDNVHRIVLIDPTAFSVLHNQIEQMSPAEKNNYYPSFEGLLLANRLTWTGISLLLLALSYLRFSFSRYSMGKTAEKKTATDGTALTPAVVRQVIRPKDVSFHFGGTANLKKVFSLATLDFKGVTRTLGFRIFVAFLMLIYICYVAIWQQEYYSAAPTLPVTLEVTSVTLPLAFYIQLFLIITTTELLFKAQTSGFWQLHDAFPVPNWIYVCAKLVAMAGVSLLLLICFNLFGVLIQTAKGYYHFDWPVYLNDLYIRWLPKYIAYILLVAFVAGVTANRYATHWICILFLFFTVILHETNGIEQNRLNFVFSPGSRKYTDMNGDSFYTLAHTWYMAYWLLLTMALLMASLWLWQRGTPVPFSTRFKKIPERWSKTSSFILLAGIGGFFLCGKKIYQVVNIDNQFQTLEGERAEAARYEKTYKTYAHDPQPLIASLKLDLDLYPESRSLQYKAALELLNTSSRPIDSLHVEWQEFSRLEKLSSGGHPLTLLHSDPELRHNIYRLPAPLLPGTRIRLEEEGSMQHTGFTNDEPQEDLAFNGTFLPQDFLPFFGYDDRRELKLNQYRNDYGLAKLPYRLPPASDRIAKMQSFASTQAMKANYVLTVSTSPAQTVVAPGTLTRSWTSQGRPFFQYRSEGPDFYQFHILSAKYSISKRRICIGGKTIMLEVYAHPGHPYNIGSLLNTAEETLRNLHSLLGPYPYNELRIAERPRYDEQLFAYGNVLVLPENHGWTADIRKQKDLDYLHFVTAKLISRQYFQQCNLSRTQGYPLMTRSFPEYLALLQLEKYNGPKALAGHLAKRKEHYLKGRALETNNEPSLLGTDTGSDYVSEDKGGYELYQLSKLTDARLVDSVIYQFYLHSKNAHAPVDAQQFYRELFQALPSKYHAVLHDIFQQTGYYEPAVSGRNKS